MTSIQALNRYENQLTFELLEQLGYDPESEVKCNNVTIDLNDSADDVVMFNGDNVHVNAKEGNNVVYMSGKNNYVKAGDGSNQIAIWGKDSVAITGKGNDFMFADGENITLTSNGGNNIFRAYGNNHRIFAGYGNDEIGVLGNNNTVVGGQGNNTIAFYGNNNNISTQKGDSKIMTLDYGLLAGGFEDMEERWIETLAVENNSERETICKYYDYSCCGNPIYASLSKEDLQFAEQVDMSELINDKYPRYVIAADSTGMPRLYAYSYTYGRDNFYYPIGHEGEQPYKAAINVTEAQTASYMEYEDYRVKYYDNYKVNGVTGNKIYFGDGDNTLKYTVADGSNDVDMANAKTGHILEQQTSYTFADVEKTSRTDYRVKTTTFFTIPVA